MNFLKKIFSKNDITEKWVAEDNLKIKINLSNNSLCNAKIGKPIEWLSKLGPCEDKKAFENGLLHYPSKGLKIGFQGDLITDYTIIFDESLEEGFKAFNGNFIYNDEEILLNNKTTQTDILNLFGEPYWKDTDDYETILFYEFKDIEWEIELSLDHKLKAILIVSPPLLSDESQRKAYKVTKPWPFK